MSLPTKNLIDLAENNTRARNTELYFNGPDATMSIEEDIYSP